jgi:hypothetical protein
MPYHFVILINNRESLNIFQIVSIIYMHAQKNYDEYRNKIEII